VVDCVTAAFGEFVAQIGKPPAPMLADYGALIARRQVHLLEDEDGIAGVIVLAAQADHLFVDVVAVRPRRQRQASVAACWGSRRTRRAGAAWARSGSTPMR
jgi:hypothetical protein